MCGTGVAAEGSVNPDSDEQQRFRVYLFTFAKSMLHEIGHMFVTFLTHGETTTPPHISGKVAGYEGKRGEAGERLENLIFGGRVVVMAKPDDREDLVCFYLPALMENIVYELIHSLGRHMLHC